MISDKDRAVVAEMCRTGMDLDVLIKSFPKFDRDDLKAIYEEVKSEDNDDLTSGVTLSCNCS